jgi:hypothetical protein
VFSWDIGPTWQLEPDPASTSEVEVRFVAEGPDRTRVEVEHRHIDRHGAGWDAIYHGVDSDEGWPLYLTRYAALLPRSDRGRCHVSPSRGRALACDEPSDEGAFAEAVPGARSQLVGSRETSCRE